MFDNKQSSPQLVTPHSSTAWHSALDKVGGVDGLVAIAQEASQAILRVYSSADVKRHTKDDGSPVTEADLASSVIIESALKRSDVPVICEETVHQAGPCGLLFWLVDPLDGTQEFLNQTGEFSVAVALISEGVPVVGLIAIPVTGEVFVGVQGQGVLRCVDGQRTKLSPPTGSHGLVAAVSRSNSSAEEDACLTTNGVIERLVCGSAIKFCRIAEGRADVYVRLGRTMEWDTAAGQCLVEELGGYVKEPVSGTRLTYGKMSSGFENPHFICSARPEITVKIR